MCALNPLLAMAEEPPNSARHSCAELSGFATSLLLAAGLPDKAAAATAGILLEGDVLGHSTHGLALLAPDLTALASGSMRKEGTPDVVSDLPAAVLWDGRRLPGPYLVLLALDLAMERAANVGTCTVVIRRSHHIGCLAAYHAVATARGLLLLLHCSDPSSASVAPHGGLDTVFTPNPISAAWPTAGAPISVDVSTSATTMALTARTHSEGGLLPAAWVRGGSGGGATNDPAVLYAEPKGSILPLGGVDSGHKGYGLSLMVEALTGGLAGHGRADPCEGWGATVFLQVIDPRAFGGLAAFQREASCVADRGRAARPAVEGVAVRTPGQRGQALKAEGVRRGRSVALHPSVMPSLVGWADKFGVPLPSPIASEDASGDGGRG